MLITALEESNAEQREALEGWLSAVDYVPAEKIAAVTALYNEIGVGVRCEEKIETLYAEGLSVLEGVALPEERKAALREFACSLMGRKV